MTQQPILTLNDGVEIPQIGLGVWQIEDNAVEGAVLAALETGYRHIDTAKIYGNERGVGAALAASGLAPEEVFVTTKLWNADQGFDSTLRAFEESAARLGREVIDLYLIHWPVPQQNVFAETWKAFVRLREEGRVRSIGVSNFNPHHIDRIVGETGVVPSVNQIELHPRFQQHGLRAYHAEKGIVIESWSPLGSGRLLGDEVLSGIAQKHGKSVAQIILRWHIGQGLIVIPKSVTPSRIAENFALFDFELDAEDIETIASLDSPDGRNGPDPDEG